jgi:hypothetical protein
MGDDDPPPSTSPNKPRLNGIFETLIRLGAAASIGVAVWSFFHIKAGCNSIEPNQCPGYALQNPLIMRGERSAAILAGLVILLVIFCRLVLQGRLPDRIGREGFDWLPKAITFSKDEIARLGKVSAQQAEQFETIRSVVEQLVNDG